MDAQMTDMTRRECIIALSVAGLLPPALLARPDSNLSATRLLHNDSGDFRFLPGQSFTSYLTTADRGYEIIYARLERMLPVWQGLEFVQRYLKRNGRPAHALCGVELRRNNQLSNDEFTDFNSRYVEWVSSWKGFADGYVPMTRVDVAVDHPDVSGPALYGFCYTVPTSEHRSTFLSSAAQEFIFDDGKVIVVASGDRTPTGMAKKAETVFGILSNRMEAAGARWDQVTKIQIYTRHHGGYIVDNVLPRFLDHRPPHGVELYYAAPPVVSVDFESDVRRVFHEVLITP